MSLDKAGYCSDAQRSITRRDNWDRPPQNAVVVHPQNYDINSSTIRHNYNKLPRHKNITLLTEAYKNLACTGTDEIFITKRVL